MSPGEVWVYLHPLPIPFIRFVPILIIGPGRVGSLAKAPRWSLQTASFLDKLD